ncbi:MAG: hypothetical protein WDN75_06405 [Bacteroidota bacterium]
MKITLSQKILLGFVACTIVLAIVAVVSFETAKSLLTPTGG